MLNELQKLTEKLNSTKGTNNKKAILATASDELKQLIQRIWDPRTKTSLTEKGLLKFKQQKSNDYLSIGNDYELLELFDNLTNRVITGHKAKSSVWRFIDKNPDYAELIIKIYEKNLRLRIGYKTVSEVFPGMFALFDVALATNYTDDIFDKMLEKHKTAFISDKKDGVRVLINKKNNEFTAKSRENNTFTTLDHIFTVLDKMNLPNDIWLDCEFISFVDSREDFKSTVSRIKKKNETIYDNAVLFVFDLLTDDEFYGKVNQTFSSRLDKLQSLVNNNDHMVQVLEQIKYTDDDQFAKLKKSAKDREIEGLMIRFDSNYEGKRSKTLLKYKFFEIDEYKIIDAIIEEMIVPNKTGGEEKILMLKNIIIHHKGGVVSVGSGFNKKERIEYAKNSIIGETAAIQYQEEFKDKKTGKMSLRIPTFHGLWGKKRNL